MKKVDSSSLVVVAILFILCLPVQAQGILFPEKGHGVASDQGALKAETEGILVAKETHTSQAPPRNIDQPAQEGGTTHEKVRKQEMPGVLTPGFEIRFEPKKNDKELYDDVLFSPDFKGVETLKKKLEKAKKEFGGDYKKAEEILKELEKKLEAIEKQINELEKQIDELEKQIKTSKGKNVSASKRKLAKKKKELLNKKKELQKVWDDLSKKFDDELYKEIKKQQKKIKEKEKAEAQDEKSKEAIEDMFKELGKEGIGNLGKLGGACAKALAGGELIANHKKTLCNILKTMRDLLKASDDQSREIYASKLAGLLTKALGGISGSSVSPAADEFANKVKQMDSKKAQELIKELNKAIRKYCE